MNQESSRSSLFWAIVKFVLTVPVIWLVCPYLSAPFNGAKVMFAMFFGIAYGCWNIPTLYQALRACAPNVSRCLVVAVVWAVVNSLLGGCIVSFLWYQPNASVVGQCLINAGAVLSGMTLAMNLVANSLGN